MLGTAGVPATLEPGPVRVAHIRVRAVLIPFIVLVTHLQELLVASPHVLTTVKPTVPARSRANSTVPISVIPRHMLLVHAFERDTRPFAHVLNPRVMVQVTRARCCPLCKATNYFPELPRSLATAKGIAHD